MIRRVTFASIIFFASFTSGVAAETSARRFELAAETSFTPERGHGFEPLAATAGALDATLFSVIVPEGNWRVTVELGGDAAGDTTVKAEARRLLLESVRTAAGEHVTRSFVVNVRRPALPAPPASAPGGAAVLLKERERSSFTWDEKLTLEFCGPAPRVRAVTLEPASVPTLFLLGDSTVTDQGGGDYASWGQMLPRFFGPTIAVANHAESGETLKSFVSELRLAKVLSQLQAGDWVLIQFGHNDQKKQWPQTYAEAATTYRAWLRVFIAEVRRLGATPVLVTSPQRRTFSPAGQVTDTHGDYPPAVRAVAAEEKLIVIDLERASRAFYAALGPALSPRAFGNSGKDGTHHNDYGAYQLARAVVQGLRDAQSPLAAHLSADVRPYDPAQPDDLAQFALAPSARRTAEKPAGN